MFAAFFIFYYVTRMLHATMLQFKYFLSIHLMSLQFQKKIKILHRWPQATCIKSLVVRKHLHFDSTFSVLLYILLCIINYTFTARGVMSRRQYSSRWAWPARFPNCLGTKLILFLWCVATVISFWWSAENSTQISNHGFAHRFIAKKYILPKLAEIYRRQLPIVLRMLKGDSNPVSPSYS